MVRREIHENTYFCRVRSKKWYLVQGWHFPRSPRPATPARGFCGDFFGKNPRTGILRRFFLEKSPRGVFAGIFFRKIPARGFCGDFFSKNPRAGILRGFFSRKSPRGDFRFPAPPRSNLRGGDFLTQFFMEKVKFLMSDFAIFIRFMSI